MTQRSDDYDETNQEPQHDEEVHGLVKAPEPNLRMYEESQAWIDRVLAPIRRQRELQEKNIAARSRPEPYRDIRGYTHRWMIKDEASAQTQTIVADVQALADQCNFKMGKPRSKYEEYALGPDRISLNDEVDRGMTFDYPPDRKRNVKIGIPAGYGECTTNAKPYDALVGAALLAIKHHLGDDVQATSTGGPQHPAWQAAKALYSRTFPEREIPWLDNWPREPEKTLGSSSHEGA